MVADFKNMQLCLLGNVAGIYQFLYKPWRPDNLRLIVNNAVALTGFRYIDLAFKCSNTTNLSF
jgi:two-component system response regulator HupR/HoxA